jgi:hypothetical protein
MVGDDTGQRLGGEWLLKAPAASLPGQPGFLRSPTRDVAGSGRTWLVAFCVFSEPGRGTLRPDGQTIQPMRCMADFPRPCFWTPQAQPLRCSHRRATICRAVAGEPCPLAGNVPRRRVRCNRVPASAPGS